MRVLILSQHFWPESFRINEVATSLVEAGCQVTVLTGNPNYPDGDVFPGYVAYKIGREQHDGYEILRVPLIPRKRGSAMRLVANYISFIVCASALGPWLLRGQRVDAIFVYGTSPILQAIAGIVLKRWKRAVLVTWVQDLWPESLQATGFVTNRHALRLVDALVRWIYRQCDLLLVQSRSFIPLVRAKSGDTPVEYHPNPGERAFDSRGATDGPAITLSPGFNVVLAGNLGTVQSLETIVAAAELLRAFDDVRFVLVGSGARADWIRGEAVTRKLSNIVLVGRFGPESMPEILSQASALLVSLIRNPIMSTTVPSKLQTYFAAGRPIIASLDGEGARVVDESGAGISCAAEDAGALANAVLALRAKPPSELGAMALAGRDYYVRNFDPATLAGKLALTLQGLMPSPPSAPHT